MTTDEDEGDIQRYFIREVKKAGGDPEKYDQGIGHRGRPDYTVYWRGWPIELVELKRPGKTPRPSQRAWARKKKKLGHEVELIDTRKKVDEYVARHRAASSD